MLVTLQSGLVQFLDATPITVEVSITRGIKYFIVGLADTALKESKQRIYTAIKNTQFHWPGQRITINLAPTTTRKFGTLLELPIALVIRHIQLDENESHAYCWSCPTSDV